MPVESLVLVPINSPGWTGVNDPTRGVEFEENTSGNQWQAYGLPATLPSNWELVGAVLRMVAGTGITVGVYDGSPNVGQVARLYQGSLSQMTGKTTATYDQNLATYYGDAAPQSTNQALTVINDIGTSHLADTGYFATVSATGTSGQTLQYIVETSADSVTWSTVQSGTIAASGGVDTVTTPSTAGSIPRWWRLSLQQVGASPWLVRCVEFNISLSATPYVD